MYLLTHPLKPTAEDQQHTVLNQLQKYKEYYRIPDTARKPKASILNARNPSIARNFLESPGVAWSDQYAGQC